MKKPDGQPTQRTQPKTGKPAEIPVPTRRDVEDLMRGATGQRPSENRGPKVRVVWKYEDEDDQGVEWGPVWVDTFADDPLQPSESEKWDEWVPLAQAREFAESRGYEFVGD